MRYSLSALALLSSLVSAGEFSTAEAPAAGCPGDFFTKKAKVFDAVTICATQRVSDKKIAACCERDGAMA